MLMSIMINVKINLWRAPPQYNHLQELGFISITVTMTAALLQLYCPKERKLNHSRIAHKEHVLLHS